MSNSKNIKMIIDMIMDRINSHIKDITSDRFYKQWIDGSNQETIVDELSSINFKELSEEDEDELSEVAVGDLDFGGEEDYECKIIKMFSTIKYEKRRELIKKLSDSIPDSNNNKKTKGQKNTERKKAVRRPKKKNTIKKPMSAYLLFCSDERVKVLNKNPEMKSKDIMKETAIRWKRINEEDKQAYILRNEELKIEYQERINQLKDEGIEPVKTENKVKTRRNKKQKKDRADQEEQNEDGDDQDGGEGVVEKKTRKVSGYVLYCREVRDRFKEENQGMSGREIVKLINISWSELSKEEKDGYSG